MMCTIEPNSIEVYNIHTTRIKTKFDFIHCTDTVGLLWVPHGTATKRSITQRLRHKT
jgi:hypothetical protein